MTNVVKGLFGGKSDAEKILERFRPAGFTSSGLSGTFSGNKFRVNRSAGVDRTLRNIRSGFQGRAGVLRDASGAFGELVPRLRGIDVSFGSSLSPELQNLRSSVGQNLGASRADLEGLRPELAGLRGDVRSLRDEVRPGFGRATRSRVEELRNQRTRAVGNLREELSRRRVMGSSFALREVGALESEFARQEDQIRAESFLQELSATDQLIARELGILGQEAGLIGAGADISAQETALQSGLIGQEGELLSQQAAQEAGLVGQEAGILGAQFQALAQSFDSSIQAAQTVLEQFNFESSIAASLSSNASQLMQSTIRAQAEARAAQDAGAAEFLGTMIGAFVPKPGKA